MKTNILFACLISILSSYDACAAGAQQDSGWCCCRRAKVPQLPQDITPPLPAAVVAPAAPQPAAATTGPQTPALTPEEIKAAGASTVGTLLGSWGSMLVPDAAHADIGAAALAAQQQQAALGATVTAGTAALVANAAQSSQQLFQMALPAATEMTNRVSHAFAPRVAAATQQAGSALGRLLDSYLPPAPKQRTTYQRFCDDYMPSILVYGTVGGGITILVRYGYYWFMGPQKIQ